MPASTRRPCEVIAQRSIDGHCRTVYKRNRSRCQTAGQLQCGNGICDATTVRNPGLRGEGAVRECRTPVATGIKRDVLSIWREHIIESAAFSPAAVTVLKRDSLADLTMRTCRELENVASRGRGVPACAVIQSDVTASRYKNTSPRVYHKYDVLKRNSIHDTGEYTDVNGEERNVYAPVTSSSRMLK